MQKTTSKFRKKWFLSWPFLSNLLSCELQFEQIAYAATGTSLLHISDKKKKVLFKEIYQPATRQAVTLKIAEPDAHTKCLTPVCHGNSQRWRQKVLDLYATQYKILSVIPVALAFTENVIQCLHFHFFLISNTTQYVSNRRKLGFGSQQRDKPPW